MKWKSLIFIPLLLSAACGSLGNLVQSATPKHAAYDAPVHSATTAAVTLSASPESITVDPQASGSQDYFDAEIDYIGTMTYDVVGENDRYSVTLTEDANNLNYSGNPLKWLVHIDPSIPLNLNIRSSSGALALNLNDFTLLGLDAETSSGSIEASLPATGEQYEAAINSSSGTVTATVEDGAQINFTKLSTSSGTITLNSGSDSILSAAVNSSSGVVAINTGENSSMMTTVETSSGNINLSFAENADGQFTLNTSSGTITLRVPAGAALRLGIEQNSSGAVTVPEWLQRVSGEDKTGVWATSGFAEAERQITITVIRTSSGAITVQ